MEERGRKPLETIKKIVLDENIECKEVKEALDYFITKFWRDLARPTLMSICCEAVGGDPELVLPFVIPLSLISAATDIHDDIIDQSRTKKGFLTVYGKYGREIALLAGDALFFLGLTKLYEVREKISPQKFTEIMIILKRGFFEVGDAEALELQFRGKFEVTPRQYLQVIKKKAADVEVHTRIAAIIGNGSKNEVESLGRYGRLLGMLIVLKDDLVDVFEYDEIQHRILYEHLPLPLIFALQNAEYREKIIDLLQRKRLSKKGWKKLIELVEEAQGLVKTRRIILNLSKQAIRCISKLRKPKNLYLLIRALSEL